MLPTRAPAKLIPAGSQILLGRDRTSVDDRRMPAPRNALPAWPKATARRPLKT